MFMRSWFISAILHIGAGLRYGCLWLFRRGHKVSYTDKSAMVRKISIT